MNVFVLMKIIEKFEVKCSRCLSSGTSLLFIHNIRMYLIKQPTNNAYIKTYTHQQSAGYRKLLSVSINYMLLVPLHFL